MKNEFDSLLEQQYEKGEFEYNPAQWDRMTAVLMAEEKPVTKKRFWLWLPFTALAASLCIFIILNVNKHAGIQHLAKEAPINVPADLNNQQIHPALAANDKIIPVDAGLIKPLNHAKVVIASKTKLHENNAEIPKTNMPVVLNADNKPERHETITLAKKDKAVNRQVNLIDPVFYEPKATSKTSLSLAGGVNYGSLNTGYMVGVNARRQLNEKIYVEGDLALVNNATSFGTTTTTTAMAPIVKNTGFEGSNSHPIALGIAAEDAATRTTTTSTPGNLFYLQVSPSVGYHVTRTIAFSVGADVQRLLKNDDKPVVAFDANNEQKLVPGFDFGLMGKTEVALSKKLKAGFQYRKGMNDVIKNSNQYLDRSYMQVQLKFTILSQ